MNESQYRTAKVIIAIVLLVILYLFALNDRYHVIDEDLMIDKWTSKTAEISYE